MMHPPGRDDEDRKRLYVNDQPVQSHEHLLRTFFGAHGAARLRSGFRMQPCGGISTVEYDDGVEGLAAYCGQYFPRAWGSPLEAGEVFPREGGEGRIPKPPDLQVTMLCTLEQLFGGADRWVRIIRCVTRSDGVIVREMFERCVSVRAGSRAGMRIRVKGAGNRIAGCMDGDVVFTIAEKTHPRFARHGDNLSVSHSITLAQALTRSMVSFSGIDGKTVNVDVWAVFSRQFSFKHGVNVLIRGAGMPAFDDPSFRGDLMVNLDVIYPPDSTATVVDHASSAQLATSSPFLGTRSARRAHTRDGQCSSFARLRRALRGAARGTTAAAWCNILQRQVCSSLRIEAPFAMEEECERARTRSDWGYSSWGGASERFLLSRLRMMMTTSAERSSARGFCDARSDAPRPARNDADDNEEECASSARRESVRRRSRRRWLRAMLRAVAMRGWRRHNDKRYRSSGAAL